jgi:hypothetical protein
MKRRQFTTSVAAIAGLSAFFGTAAFTAALDLEPETGTADPLMARDRFEARLGQQFTARGSAVDTELRLNDVISAVRGHEQEQFHVLFEAPAGQELPEGIYFLEANGKTEFGLHLLPGEAIAGRQQMIATVNLQSAA